MIRLLFPMLFIMPCATCVSSCGPISPMVYAHGVPNLDRVDDNVYRSGQITTQEGWDYIRQVAGVRRIHVVKLNFDAEGSDAAAVAMGLDVHVEAIQPEGDVDVFDALANAFRRPSSTQIDQAETILSWSLGEPDDFYLVHCTHGQDRTGLIIGMHRVLHDGWTKKAAYDEMLAHHFHPELHGLHETWEDFTPP